MIRLQTGHIPHNTGIADSLSGLGAALAALAEQLKINENFPKEPYIKLREKATFYNIPK